MRRVFILFLISFFMFSSCEIIDILDDFIFIVEEEPKQPEKPKEPADKENKDETQDKESAEDIENLDKNTLEYVRLKALEYAKEYVKANAEYGYGKQDFIRSIKVDCSGMVINCYKIGVQNTKYKLPFTDATAATLYSQYTERTYSPQPGDLIFFSYSNGKIDHVGIFEKIQGDTVYFIDAIESEGVSHRSYAASNKKIKGYGVMKLKQK
ncbi:MAG: NlpC/P60 family protein [Treponema bryantii]|nr:NlpC/P60 family protein [Treponema bryantii]